VPGGCELDGGGSGVAVHYRLQAESVTFALSAPTTGYVSLAIVPTGQRCMFPADAVAGWMGETDTAVVAYQLNGYLPMDVLASGVRLSNTSACETDGATTVRFSRRYDAGRYPISPSDVTFHVAHGPSDGLTAHTAAGTVRANLFAGSPRPDPPARAGNATRSELMSVAVFSCAAIAAMMIM